MKWFRKESGGSTQTLRKFIELANIIEGLIKLQQEQSSKLLLLEIKVANLEQEAKR